jgi:hypothetical protein
MQNLSYWYSTYSTGTDSSRAHRLNAARAQRDARHVLLWLLLSLPVHGDSGSYSKLEELEEDTSSDDDARVLRCVLGESRALRRLVIRIRICQWGTTPSPTAERGMGCVIEWEWGWKWSMWLSCPIDRTPSQLRRGLRGLSSL